MYATQAIPCPNCGSQAQRSYFTSKETDCNSCPSNQVIQTECPVCDYLMVMCSVNGAVVEAHAPGTSAKELNLLEPVAAGNHHLVRL